MSTLKQRLAAGVASLALAGFLAAPVTAEARTVRKPKPAALTDVGDWLNWDCLAGVTVWGSGVVITALAAPESAIVASIVWTGAAYGSYETAGSCMADAPPGLFCGPYKYSAVDGSAKYYQNSCQVGAGGGGGGSWGDGPSNYPPVPGGGSGGGSW